MNICLVSQEYPPETARGGIGTQTWNKAKSLSQLGHEVHVLTCAGAEGPDLRSESCSGVMVHRMQTPDQGPSGQFPVYSAPAYWLGYSWAVLRQMHNLMKAARFDVIDFAEYGAEGFAYQLDRAPWNWAPVIVQLHGPLAMLTRHMGWPEKDSEFCRVGSFMEGTSIRLADGLTACSANIADFTAEFYGVERESIDVVHCGVDAEAFRPGDQQARLPARPTVLFVGNIAPNKGVDDVLEAILRLRSKYPGIRLQIAGKGDDDLEQNLRDRACTDGTESCVQFCGFVDRIGLPELYRRADVFCSPAQYEGGVANVYIEAMACGCPVVASTAGAAPEAVVDGETGILVPPRDVEATVRALDTILGERDLRGRMGEAGRRRVEDYFAMDKYILRILTAYQRTMERSLPRLRRFQAAAGCGGE